MKLVSRAKEMIKKVTEWPQFWDRFQVAIVATFWIGFIFGLIVLGGKHPPKDLTRPEYRFTPSGKFY